MFFLRSRFFRLLASPGLALALLGLMLLAVLMGGTLPQTVRLSPQELDAWHRAWPLLSLSLERLGLADVYASAGFQFLYVALIVNLTAGTAAHVAYLFAWFKGETPGRSLHLSELPPALLPLADAGTNGRRRGSLGLAGLPLLHAGIVVIIVAALVNGSDRLGAHFELAEGEVLSQANGKLRLERGSRQIEGELDFRLRLDALLVEMEGGSVRELQARVSLQQAGGALRQETLAVNHPLRIGSSRVYLDKNVGQAG
ncbi:MAG: cytochrome c biogenesis protein ResB, partial [Thiobacillus sp.]|nr:cytochrome c biogenesis protein ResB [Thiobacillus sp.]